jgi:hypothetical protein
MTLERAAAISFSGPPPALVYAQALFRTTIAPTMPVTPTNIATPAARWKSRSPALARSSPAPSSDPAPSRYSSSEYTR